MAENQSGSAEKRFLSQIEDRYMLRLPGNMRQELKDAAKAANRTLNSEIIHRLTTWRDASASSIGTARIDVDTTEVKAALVLVEQLGEAAERVAEACAKLGIKIGGA